MYAIQQYYKVMLLGVGWGVVLLHHDGIMFTILHNNTPPPPPLPLYGFPSSLIITSYIYVYVYSNHQQQSFLSPSSSPATHTRQVMALLPEDPVPIKKLGVRGCVRLHLELLYTCNYIKTVSSQWSAYI